MSGPPRTVPALRRADRQFFGTRSRIGAMLRRSTEIRIPPRYRGLHWLTAVIALLLLLEFATGMLLALYYDHSPGEAHRSTRFVISEVPVGWLVRGVHHWAAEFLLLAAVAHMAVVFFRRAYAWPREYEWVLGVLLLLGIVGERFTGRLLPWDRIGVEVGRRGLDLLDSVPVVGDWMARWLRGGADMGAKTLNRFFATHVLILPWVIALLAYAHFRLVRRHGLKEEE